MLSGAPGPIDLGEGAPWWGYALVGLVAILAPLIVPKLLERRTRAASGDEAGEDDDPEVRELRDTLISVLTKLQRVEAQAEDLERSLAARTDELTRERRQTAALTEEVVELRSEVNRLRTLIEGMAQR